MNRSSLERHENEVGREGDWVNVGSEGEKCGRRGEGRREGKGEGKERMVEENDKKQSMFFHTCWLVSSCLAPL